MGQPEHLWGIQGKDTCALFTDMGSSLTNKISRNVRQFFWEEGSDGWIDVWIAGLLDGWMDGWMDGWVDGWMDGWMDRRIAGLENKHQENRVFHRIFRKTVS